MPVLQPVPIPTRELGPLTGLWRWLTAKRRWRVAEDWRLPTPWNQNSSIYIPKGFIFDGASIPRPLWSLLDPVGLLLIPGLVHDFEYRYGYLLRADIVPLDNRAVTRIWSSRSPRPKRDADLHFRLLTREINRVCVLNWIVWAAVSLGGWWAWRANRQRNEPPYWPAELLDA